MVKRPAALVTAPSGRPTTPTCAPSTGAPVAESLTTPLTGTLSVTGSLSAKANDVVNDAIGGLLGGSAAKQLGSINIKNLNVSGEIKGNVIVTSRPRLAANWRIEPNLQAQVNLGDTSLNAAGAGWDCPPTPDFDWTSPDLNVFAELATMRALAPSVPASSLLASATYQGARALGFDADYGTIEPGKSGRLLTVDVPAGTDDVEEYLVSGIQPEQVGWVPSEN